MQESLNKILTKMGEVVEHLKNVSNRVEKNEKEIERLKEESRDQAYNDRETVNMFGRIQEQITQLGVDFKEELKSIDEKYALKLDVYDKNNQPRFAPARVGKFYEFLENSFARYAIITIIVLFTALFALIGIDKLM